MPSSCPRIVIIGAGFAGLEVVRGLRNAQVDITVIDKKNHHCFQPLLYQVATAALSPADIAWPVRLLLAHQSNVLTVMGEVSAIDPKRKSLSLGPIPILTIFSLSHQAQPIPILRIQSGRLRRLV